jgi:hypothetical protein
MSEDEREEEADGGDGSEASEKENEGARASASIKGAVEGPGAIPSPNWKAPSVATLFADDDESDDDDGESMLGRATADRLNGLLEGRTLGNTFKSRQPHRAGGSGGAMLGGGAGGGGGSLAPLSLKGRSWR